ncbi:endonuclease NucS domain-containing protein [Nodosilinea sp. AN01ver1]|uniref:endonuclease NucS domain-containing protein n=1 Tax=Nodosilinea sp. AN01ver1 TaxID=3423362 RepID=UPI003D3212B9
MAITAIGDTWQFGSEFELEETVWKNLPKLLNLKPFKRQYSIRGQFCDILALDDQQRLVIIELKNTEDRYVVQQLTRYYNALKGSTPFGSEVDFEQPVRLIAIAPGFHQDTLVDCKYSILKIELVTFSIRPQTNSFALLLNNSEGQTIGKSVIKQEKSELSSEIVVPEPSRKLLNWLSHSSDVEFKAFVSLRRQIMSFDERMKEVVEPQRIIYGRGKTKPCAEIKPVKEIIGDRRRPVLFLWLPHPENKPQVLRMMIWAKKDWKEVESILYSPSSNKTKQIWHFPAVINWMKTFNYKESLKLYQPILDENQKCSPASLVGLALETWRARF